MTKSRKIFIGILLLCLVWALIFHGKRVSKPFYVQLTSKIDVIRYMAFRKLYEMDIQKRKLLIPHLAKQLKDEDPKVRRFALYSMRIIGVEDEKSKEAVLATLLDPSSPVRKEAVTSSASMGPSIIKKALPLFSKLSPDTKERFVLFYSRFWEQVVPHLVDFLDDPDPILRLEAIKILSIVGKPARKAGPRLLYLLKDPDPDIRFWAATTLSRFDPSDPRPLSIYIKRLRSLENEPVYFEVLTFLSRMGQSAKSISPQLNSSLLEAPDGFLSGPYRRPALAAVLSDIDPRSETNLGLGWDMKHKNPAVRYRAVWFIGDKRGGDRRFVPDLVKALDDEIPFVAARALYAIEKIGIDKAARFHEKIIPQIILSMEKIGIYPGVEGYRELVGKTLENVFSKSLPTLMSFFQARKISFKSAEKFLAQINIDQINSLEAYLNYGDPGVRLVAALTLARKGFLTKNIENVIRVESEENNFGREKEAQEILAR